MKTIARVVLATTCLVLGVAVADGVVGPPVPPPTASLAGCNAFQKQIARSVIDVGLAACLAEHADVDDESALREICKWADDIAPLVKDLLLARRRGMAKARMAAQACGPDGGK